MSDIDRGDVLDLYRDLGVLRQRVVEGDIDGVDALREAEQLVEELLSESADTTATAGVSHQAVLALLLDGDISEEEIGEWVEGDASPALRRLEEGGWVGRYRGDGGETRYELSALAEWLREK